MTSTPFSVGLSEESRLSSRVLRPPGGGHTDIFGSEPEPPRVGRRPGPNTAVAPPPAKAEEAKTNGASVASGASGANGSSEASVNGGCASPQEAPPQAPLPSPADAPQEAPRESPKEPAKEPPKEASKAEPARAEAPKRVRVPPGGFSSGLW